jgi:hypothetical protein
MCILKEKNSSQLRWWILSANSLLSSLNTLIDLTNGGGAAGQPPANLYCSAGYYLPRYMYQLEINTSPFENCPCIHVHQTYTFWLIRLNVWLSTNCYIHIYKIVIVRNDRIIRSILIINYVSKSYFLF